MLGLLLGLMTSCAKVIGDTKEAYEDQICKEKYINVNGLTYIDSHGRNRLLSNDHIAIYTFSYQNYEGNYILLDIEENKVIYNFSSEDKNSKKQILVNDAKNINNTTILVRDLTSKLKYQYCKASSYYKTKFLGEQFQDINNENIYVIRQFNQKYYYLNIHNGLIARETDYSRKNLKNIQGIDIRQFNDKQKEDLKTYNFYPYYTYEYDVKYH